MFPMGTELRIIEVHGLLSDHNSDQDKIDESLWEELRCRITMIAKEHRYESLMLDVL